MGLPRHGAGWLSAASRRRAARQFARMAQLERRQRIPRHARQIRGRARECGPDARSQKRRARLSETLEPALPDHLDQQAERLMRKICDEKLKIATAESCTGGMFAALMTDIEGCGHGF